MSIITNDQIIDAYVKYRSRDGWIIVHRAENGAQFTARKQWKKHGLLLGLILLPFWGIGLIVWLLTLLDYLMAEDKMMFASVTQMETELRARRK